MKKKFINLAASIFSNLVLIVFGLLLPKILISEMGSEINGYLSTANTIFGYVALVEAGLGAACLNSLYKPLSEKNGECVANIVKSSRKQYCVVALLYFLISSSVAFIFPLFVTTDIPYITLALVIFLGGLGGSLLILLTSAIKQLLLANGEHYIELIIHSVFYIISSCSQLLVIKLTKNIILMQSAFVICQIVEGLIYFAYFKIRYKKISAIKCNGDYKFSEKKYFVVHQISNVVFSCTDILLISTLCSLKEASIYSVYSLIFLSVSKILNSIFASLSYILGDSYFKDRNQYIKTRRTFGIAFNALSFSLLTVALLLCNPFVRMYTSTADINYVDLYLPNLFFITEILTTIRLVPTFSIKVSNNVKQNIWSTITESAINILVSIFGCMLFGIYGVLIGTICALSFRTIQTFIYERKRIVKTSESPDILNLFLYVFVFIFLYRCSSFIKIELNSYLDFIVYGIVYTLICLFAYFGVAVCISAPIRISMLKFIRKICRKCKTLFLIVANVLALFLLYPIALIAYKRKRIYLFGERGIDAKDNAFALFKFYVKNRPDVNCVYLISKKSSDYDKVSKIGKAIEPHSFKHWLIFIASACKITTHVYSLTPSYYIGRYYWTHHIPGKHVFLQHGVTYNYTIYSTKKVAHLDLYCCAGKPEFDYINHNYGYKNGEVVLSGFSRFDNLHKNNEKKQIVIMPTWRLYLSNLTHKQFVETDYYKCWNNLLNSDDLIEEIEKENITLIFYVHHEMQKYCSSFVAKSKNIIIAKSNEYDVQTLLKESKLMITDYSSVFFDFAYMHKPCLFYQFDYEEFYSGHYQKSYFDFSRDGFGKVFADSKKMIDEVKHIINVNFKIDSSYEKRISDFFPLCDENNCSRIMEYIDKLF